METFDKAVKFIFNKPLNKTQISNLKSELTKVEGVNAFELSPDCICINYVTYHFSEESLRNLIKDFGFLLTIEKKKKKDFFKRFIDNLAKTNKETYGNKKLDCCQLKD